VAISGDTVVVGGPRNNPGAAYIFEKPANGWAGNLIESARLTAAQGGTALDFFGNSVGISGDTVVVGAQSASSVQSPAAYVFVKQANGWAGNLNETAKLSPSDPPDFASWFGRSVAISGDTLVVGLFEGAYVFVKPAGGWAGEVVASAKLTASDGAFLDDFGAAVAISGDKVLIGASGHNDAKGSAYVFAKPENGWSGNLSESAKLTVSNAVPFDLIGSSVAINGEALVVGAEEWTDTNSHGSAYVFSDPTVPDIIPPTITLTTPPQGAAYTLNQVVNADYSCQDEAGGSGLATCVGSVPSGSPIGTASVGAKTFVVTTSDNAGNAASLTHTYSVNYNFTGFFQPVDNLPTINVAKASSAIPVKFSLHGNQGLNIFAAGYPASQQINCESSSPASDVDETITAGASSLSYDPATDQYTYIWKTSTAWKGACRQLQLKLRDNTLHVANFRFK
jgi:hypothetical protein